MSYGFNYLASAQSRKPWLKDVAMALKAVRQDGCVCFKRKRENLNRKLGARAKMKSSFFRAASYGMFEESETSGTLDCGHLNTIGNGTPVLIVSWKKKGT